MNAQKIANRFSVDNVCRIAQWIIGSFVMLMPALAEAGEGELLWAKQAGGEDSLGLDISMLPDGSSLIIGDFRETSIFGPGEQNETHLTPVYLRDVFFAKYHPDGTLAWAKQAGGLGTDRGFSIAAASDGSFWATGFFGNHAVFGPGEENETELLADFFGDTFIARYKPDGTFAWVKRVYGTYTDSGRGIATLPDGGAVVVGVFHDLAMFTPDEEYVTPMYSYGGADAFVAKYDELGVLLWVEQAGGESSDDSASDVALLSDGSILVEGHFFDTAWFGHGEEQETSITSLGRQDSFLAKYDPEGTLAWARHLAGTADENPTACRAKRLAVLPDDSIVVTGCFYGSTAFAPGQPNETQLDSAGDEDIFVAKYSADGFLCWARRAGGLRDDQAEDVATLSDGSILVTGRFEHLATFGPGERFQTVLAGQGAQDIFIAQYDLEGRLAWARRAGGTSWEGAYGIGSLPEGTAVVTGGFGGTAIFGHGEPHETTLSGQNSFFAARFETAACGHHGDVNGDGAETAEDAQLTFMTALGTYQPSYEPHCAADCNGDGVVTAGDAQAIFAAVLGMGTCIDPLPAP